MREAKEAETGRKAALAEVTRLELSIDAEVLRSLRRREERDGLKRENTLLQAENQLLREAVADLEANEDPSFEDGYFTASYEVVQGLPADFDLQAAFGWSREKILAKASELAAPNPGNPVEASDVPGPSSIAQGGLTEGGVQDPPIAPEEKVQGPVSSPEVILVDQDATQVGVKGSEAKDAGDVEGPAETVDPRQEERAKEQEDV